MNPFRSDEKVKCELDRQIGVVSTEMHIPVCGSEERAQLKDKVLNLPVH